MYAKNPQAMSMATIPYIFSLLVTGLISPYPTVVIVVKEKYTQVIYFSYKVKS